MIVTRPRISQLLKLYANHQTIQAGQDFLLLLPVLHLLWEQGPLSVSDTDYYVIIRRLLGSIFNMLLVFI
jgi:hypothetical protein